MRYNICFGVVVALLLVCNVITAETYDYSVFRKGSPIDIKLDRVINNFGPYAGFTPVLVGDLNADGKPELVTVINDYRDHCGSFIVVDGADVGKHQIVNYGADYGYPGVSFGYSCCPIAISKSGYIYVVAGTKDQKNLLKYSYSKSSVTLLSSVPLEHNFYGIPRIADFNKDGRVEVFVGNEVFDGETLSPIGSGGEFNVGQHCQHDGAMFMMGCAADVIPDNDGLELVCGNQIYGVSRSGVVLLNTIGMKHDGSSQAVDVDNDGKFEILSHSSVGKLSLYDVANNRPIFVDEYTMKGYPCIGDIDGDSIPEIVGLVSSSKMVAYKFDKKTQRLKELWTMTHSDRSAQTSMTMFDFNGDGKQEIVYRDEETLRLIDGSTSKPVTIANMSVSSATKSEYPVVADVDGDGQAEIIVPGTMFKKYTKNNASINIFKSNRWAWNSAPMFWGQY